ISNWTDRSYTGMHLGALRVTRETYHAISNQTPRPNHALQPARIRVHDFLQNGNVLTFNNGDPILYGPGARGIFEMLQQIAQRGKLANPNTMEVWASVARRPIETVSKAQLDFCRKGQQLVGGKPHELAVDSVGRYFSRTGD
ncbi:MAG TPA: hypothetical protein VGL97_03310, partial [Bryobacteraceae bacterium]